jgi:hypothetical protein
MVGYYQKAAAFVIVACLASPVVLAQSTCTLDLPDGTSRTFADGDPLGAFLPNRCGSEFPCYCNPSIQGQIDCPYCPFASMGGDLVCARDGETVTYQDLQGVNQICSCQLSSNGSDPISTCSEVRVAVLGFPVAFDPEDTCTIRLPDGTSQTFANGEALEEFRTNRCGTDFPCFCNPSVPGQIECPYCRFPSMGGDLVCARHDQTVSYQDLDEQDRTCSCQVPVNGGEPISTCNGARLASPPLTSIVAFEESTCTWDGEVFQRGESLGTSFETRCGPALYFPCYCNPDLDPPMECPYCGFALSGGDLLCIPDNEVVSFVDINGDDKTCGCSASMGETPTPNCEMSSDATCTMDLPDGTSRTFVNGEALGAFLPNRCGSEFPCYCNPSLPGQIECPYCRFPSIGGDLVCARAGETVSYQDLDGGNQTCSCQDPGNGDEPISSCDVGLSSPVATPNRPPTDNQIDVCSLELDSGQIITFANGESYGDYMPTRCGNTTQFPCFCNTALSNKAECPYCGFVTGDGSLQCAKDSDTISFNDGTITRTCSCEIPENPNREPIRSCSVGGPPPTSAPIALPTTPDGCSITQPNGDVVTIEDGESFGTLVEGVCGPAIDWPSLCNVDLATTISRQNSGDNVEYPYCIFENTESGETVCARNNEEVTFADDKGVKLTCGCSYLNPALGGPQSSCRKATQTTTPAPIPPPTPTMAPTDPTDPKGSSAFAKSSSWTAVSLACSMLFAVNGMF